MIFKYDSCTLIPWANRRLCGFHDHSLPKIVAQSEHTLWICCSQNTLICGFLLSCSFYIWNIIYQTRGDYVLPRGDYVLGGLCLRGYVGGLCPGIMSGGHYVLESNWRDRKIVLNCHIYKTTRQAQQIPYYFYLNKIKCTFIILLTRPSVWLPASSGLSSCFTSRDFYVRFFSFLVQLIWIFSMIRGLVRQ